MAAEPPALVLASASPRRRDLIAHLGLPFLAVSNDGEERTTPVPPAVLALLPDYHLDVALHPALLAWRKAQAARDEGLAGVILGADTIVVLDGRVLGKPRDEAHAHELLAALSGRWHTVYTGLAALPAEGSPAGEPLFDLVRTEVELAPLSADQIAAYVATGEPLDKAGAYGVQGLGGRLVRDVRGSFTNVVGLPLQATFDLLERAGLAPPVPAAEAWNRWRPTLLKEGPCINPSMF
ncbi:MAG TPA: Maf family protein [Herpetosiphonaceae bacterium]